MGDKIWCETKTIDWGWIKILLEPKQTLVNKSSDGETSVYAALRFYNQRNLVFKWIEWSEEKTDRLGVFIFGVDPVWDYWIKAITLRMQKTINGAWFELREWACFVGK